MLRGTALAAALLATGCATIVSESTWPITIHTAPPGATVAVTKSDGTPVASGMTPLQVHLDSGDGYFGRASYQIVATQPSGVKSTATLTSHFNGWYIGNLVFGGLIGFLIVDPLTGAMYRFDETFIVQCNSTTGAVESLSADGRSVVSLDEVPAELRAHLVPLAP